MVGEFLVNPRRSPRAPARCRAQLRVTDAAWETPTEDVGPHGCKVIVPRALTPGTPVQVALRNAAMPEPLVVAGRVAWVAPSAPHRAGIAFVEGAHVASTRWFDQLLSANPELSWARRTPSHLPMDAMVFLGPPPKYLFDFSRDEAAVLRHVASGATVREVRNALRERAEASTRAIFSLLARRHLTFARGASVHPTAWRRILADLETSSAADALASSRAPSRLAPAPQVDPRPSMPARPIESRASLRRLDAGGAWNAEPEAPRARSFEAQGAFQRALSELAAGRTETAIILLRRASALAPGDVEIGRTLAEVGFRHALRR